MTLCAERVEIRYGRRVALQPTSFELARGQVVALIGPNGAGKSSLLKALAGLLEPGGTVSWCGRSLAALDPRERARTVAYLPQQPRSHWPLSVEQLVALGRMPHRRFGAAPSEEDRDIVAWAMAETEVAELAARPIDELSGGEHARAQLARALAVTAPVLLVDEPVASVDPYHQLQIMAALQARAAGGALIIAVMHDLALAARCSTEMMLIDAGSLVAQGTPEQVLSADTLRRHYRVETFLARHEEQLVVLPWRRLD